MHLKTIQNIFSKIEKQIPECYYKDKFKAFIKKYEIWSTTFNIKVACNFGKNTDYKVFEIENFFSDEVCDLVIKLAKKKGMVDSTVVNDEGKRIIDISTRKSKQCWLEDSENNDINKISETIAKLCNIPVEHQEHLQVVSYEPECYYKPHFDASYHPNVIPVMNHGCGPRIYTFIIYLNECEGGETEFPKLGIKIKPKKGKAILFQNIDNNLDLIPESMHAGCQVTSGVKWIANKWIRVWPFEIANIIKLYEQKQEFSNYTYFEKIKYFIPKSFINYKYIKSLIYHNIFCRNFPFAIYNKNFNIYEIDNYISDSICNNILYDNININDLDNQITTDLNSFISVPTEDPFNHFTKLNIIKKYHTDGTLTISPYTNVYKTKGIPLCSIYIFINDDYIGGAFTFPNVNKTIQPKKGKAIMFLSVDNSLAFEPNALCCINSIENNRQIIIEKHIQLLPTDLKFILEEPDEWVQRVYTTLKDNCVSTNQ